MSDLREKAIASVLDKIENSKQEIIEFLKEYVRIKSVNPDLLEEGATGSEEQEVQEWIRDGLAGTGFYDKLDYWEEVRGRPNVASVLKGSGGGQGRSLMFNGHSDTVPVTADQKAVWQGSPWSAELRDGKIWGRGAADMKGGNTSFLLAAKFLNEAGVRLKDDVILTLTIGEESGRHRIGCDSILKRGYRASFAIIPEPTNLVIFPALKGEIYFKVTVKGKTTHICNRNKVVQPLPLGVERPGVSAIDKMLKIQQEVMNLENQWALYREHPLVPQGGMFISINTIKGGESFTSVPGQCEATGSLLFNPDLKSPEVIAEVKSAVDRVTQGDYWLTQSPPELEIPWNDLLKEPVNVSPDHEGCVTLGNALSLVTGKQPEFKCSPFVCDANFWYPQGQDTIVFGPGDITMGAHGPNEFVPVDQLFDACKVWAIVMIDWCGVSSIK